MKKILRILGISRESYLLYMKSHLVDVGAPILDDKYSVVELDHVDKLIDSKFNFSKNKIKLFKLRFSQEGYSCFAVKRGSEVVYYCWISKINFEFPGEKNIKKLGVQQGLLLDAMCHPSERGSGIHTYMNHYRCNHLFNSGKKEALVLVLYENKPAIRSQEKIGFRLVEKVKLTNIFGNQYITIST